MSTPPVSVEAERARIGNQVREAAIASVKGFALGEGLLAQIIDRATDDLTGSPWGRRSHAERLQIAENIAAQYVASAATKPLNLPSATPEEIAAKRLALGLTANIGWPGQQWFSRDTAGGSGSSGGSDRASSAVYDGLSGKSGDWSSPAGQSYMRDYAVRQGVPWAANNTELLKLGPAAIDTLRDAHLKKEVYEGLTKKAGFEPKAAVNITRWAHEHGRDANEAGTAVTQAVEVMTPDQAQLYRGAVDRLTNSKRPDGREKSDEEKKADADNYSAVGERIKHDNPAAAKPLDKADDKLGVAMVKNGAEVQHDKNTVAAANTLFGGTPAPTPDRPATSPSAKGKGAVSSPAPAH